MEQQLKTPSDVTALVIDALYAYKTQYPLLGEEVEEIRNTPSVPRIHLTLKTGETFVIDISRKPKPI